MYDVTNPPNHRYRAIYADPPWNFKTYSPKGEGRSASSHYDVLDYAKLASFPVAEWAADDCALFLWVTDPMLETGLKLIEAWGFDYKTIAFYWVKLNKGSMGRILDPARFFMGTGYWTRANPEMCLLATTGKPSRLSRSVRKLVVAERREHSRKPDEVRESITRLVPGPYLELFARQGSAGWDVWGNQTKLFDAGPVKTRRFPSSSS